MDSQDTQRRHLRVVETRSTRADAHRAWSNSRQRYVAIAATLYLVAAAYGLVATVDNALVAAIVPAAGYLVSSSVLKWMRNRWVVRYLQAAEKTQIDLRGPAAKLDE